MGPCPNFLTTNAHTSKRSLHQVRFSELGWGHLGAAVYSQYDLVIGPNRVRGGWASITSGLLDFLDKISKSIFSPYTPDPSSDVITPRFIVIDLEFIVTFVDTIPNQSKMSGQFQNQGVQSVCTGTIISQICASVVDGLRLNKCF